MNYFGVPMTSLDLPTTYYIIVASGSVLTPIMLAGLLTAAVAFVHPGIVAALQTRDPATARRLLTTFTVLGMSVATVGILGAFGLVYRSVNTLTFWLALAAGLASTFYALFLRSQTGIGGHRSFSPLAQVSISVLIAGALFGGLSVYLARTGTATAMEIANSLTFRSSVRVFSTHPLAITGPGVSEIGLGSEEEGAYRYAYDGLAFLIRSGGRYFLAPQDWRPGSPVIVLQEASTMRFEFHRPF